MISPDLVAAAVLSSTIGFVAVCALWAFFLFGLRRGMSGWAAQIATSAMLGWLLLLRITFAIPERATLWHAATVFAELMTYALWVGVCLRVLGIAPRHFLGSQDPGKTLVLRIAFGASLLSLAVGAGYLVTAFALPAQDSLREGFQTAIHGTRLAASITGLLLVEQVARNTRRDYHWNLKFLVFALLILFGYAFVMYADAVLFGRQSAALAAAHGAVVALTTPFFLIATLRNRTQRLNVSLSRRLVFRTGTLLVTGGYLLLISLGGFWLRTFGGDWGQVLAVLFVVAALVAGLVLASSRTLRERFQLTLARNLFAQKHDYRDAWLRITETLLDETDDATLPQRAVRALGEIVHAHRGALWRLSDAGTLLPVDQLRTDWRRPLGAEATAALEARFAEEDGPVLVRVETKRGVEPRFSEALNQFEGAHLAVPLLTGDRLYGLVLLSAPETGQAVDWEDEELLRIAARQIASALAQQDAQAQLSEHAQAAAFNQMTAFVVHDLKTVVAQLSLLVRNAETHKTNPAFVDDMIRTTQHATQRMQTLLGHLRGGAARTGTKTGPVTLRALIEAVAARQGRLRPHPETQCVIDAAVPGEADRLASALAHLVQNAQEATPDEGCVILEGDVNGDWAEIRIRDTGPGMDPEFIRTRLFRPFSSTKGVAGMGIGTWQAREQVRALGGDIEVETTPGAGTTFRVRLPVVHSAAAASAS
ncbi:MAG: XrtA/PEP-CTERM system histidine kinase PrsK [Pseudomonadales bacterium]|jgi:putative PEP-CTERM system histidine kinase|nr:XrtA/PEP-CTERM system histidine kinase PrsK [Pseudomonadales bacterium]